MQKLRKRLRAIIYLKDQPVRLVFNGEITESDMDAVLDTIYGQEELPVSTSRVEKFSDFGSRYSILNLTSERQSELNAKIDGIFRGTKKFHLKNAQQFTDVVKAIGFEIGSRN